MGPGAAASAARFVGPSGIVGEEVGEKIRRVRVEGVDGSLGGGVGGEDGVSGRRMGGESGLRGDGGVWGRVRVGGVGSGVSEDVYAMKGRVGRVVTG